MKQPPKRLRYLGATYVRADAAHMQELLTKSKTYLQELFEDWAREPTNLSGLRRLFSDADAAWAQERLQDKFLTDLGALAEDQVDFSKLAQELAGKK
jgi:hypothetical protein